MAGPFRSGRREVPCYNCQKQFAYFKMIESWRPEHPLDGPMTLLEEEGKEPASTKEGKKDLPHV
eukprot:4243363-Prorocentrum_lima.AAC.1